jgi:hypothetical protein
MASSATCGGLWSDNEVSHLGERESDIQDDLDGAVKREDDFQETAKKLQE